MRSPFWQVNRSLKSQESVTVCWGLFWLSLPNLVDGLGESEAWSGTLGSWETSQVPHNIIHLLRSPLYILHSGAHTLLTSSLATNYSLSKKLFWVLSVLLPCHSPGRQLQHLPF
jgi:hypothetical protein